MSMNIPFLAKLKVGEGSIFRGNKVLWSEITLKSTYLLEEAKKLSPIVKFEMIQASFALY